MKFSCFWSIVFKQSKLYGHFIAFCNFCTSDTPVDFCNKRWWYQLFLLRQISEFSSFRWCRICKLLLAFAWYNGLLVGTLIAAMVDIDVFSLMRTAGDSRVSIVVLMAVIIIPFLISVLSVSLSKPWLLLPVCFFKAFSLGYCISGVCIIYGSAGWLVRLLLLFSSTVSAPVLYWFWLRHISGTKKYLWLDFMICAAVVFLITVIDYRMIAPLWDHLLNT